MKAEPNFPGQWAGQHETGSRLEDHEEPAVEAEVEEKKDAVAQACLDRA